MIVSGRVRRALLASVAGVVLGMCAGVVSAHPEAGREPPVRPHAKVGEESFYADGHPAGSEAQLGKAGEKLAQAQAAFIEGLTAEDDGEWDQALRAYTTTLQADVGGNPGLAVRIANEYAKRGDVATGIDLLKDLAKAKPDDATPLLNLAGLYLRELHKPDLALRYAEGAARIAPNNLAAYQTLFDVFLALKRRRDAEALLKRAGTVDSKDPVFWLSLSELAVRLYLTSDGAFPPAKAEAVTPLLKKAGDLSTEDGAATVRTADGYVAIGQVGAAIPFYLRALALNHGSGDVRYKLAQSFLKTGQRDEAIRALEELVKGNPLRPEPYEFLARLLEENRQFERALANYQQVLLLAPDDPENYLRTAQVQLELRQNDGAVATLSEARRRFPAPQITYALAIALSQAKRYADALPAFESAMQDAEARGGAELLDGAFYYNYAVAAEQADMIDKAATLLRKAIDLEPSKAASAYNFLGYMWVERKLNLEEAGEMIRRALQIEPNNGAYLDSLGWYYYQRGEYGEALSELLHAVELVKPEDAVVLEHLGDAHAALGNYGQAINAWGRALTLDPGNAALATKIEAARTKTRPTPPNQVPGGAATPGPDGASGRTAPVPHSS